MPNYTLPRSERLRSLKAIRRMFGEGHSGFVYPFRYVWIATEPCGEDAEMQPCSERGVEVMFSVPKKFHKRANKRNLLNNNNLSNKTLKTTISLNSLKTTKIRSLSKTISLKTSLLPKAKRCMNSTTSSSVMAHSS